MSISQEALPVNQPEETLISPYLGRTVLELIANHVDEFEENLDTQDKKYKAHRPPPTPPTPMQTNTKSGNPPVVITDDNMTDHLYE